MWYISTKHHPMSFSEKMIKAFRQILPSPFTIAILLTFLTFILALLFTSKSDQGLGGYALTLLGKWEAGLWHKGLMVFCLQMMLMLVLGHVLALTKPVNYLIEKGLTWCKDTATAAFTVTLLTLLVALFNWGLGLIFGAIFARKVGEKALREGIPLNYPLIGAAGYSGLMVWHGGISGSATTKVAEAGHLKSIMKDNDSADFLAILPDQITFAETVFSTMNIVATLAIVITLTSFVYWLGKRSNPQEIILPPTTLKNEGLKVAPFGAEKLDHSRIMASLVGGIILFYAFYKAFVLPENISLAFINPNYINFTLLGLGILFHGNFHYFLRAVNEAITGASGILIQFPLYFGIMGLMNGSGLVNIFSDFFIAISNDITFPLWTFVSAGIVNIFVPSGGGQWAVQGPVIIETAQQLGISLPKCIMALCYGDQLTNMLQPFWALPLLGITGLKAKEILPYTLMLMGLGILVFSIILLIF